MGAQLIPAITFRDFNNNGVPLAFGQVFSYQAGTTTPVATYTDYTQSVQNPNPIILNARGEAQIWLNPSQAYKFVVQDSLGNTIRTVDQILGGLSGLIAASLIPTTSNLYTLGNTSNSWANLYLGPNADPAYNSSADIVGYMGTTAAESAVSVTPNNGAYFGQPWLWVRREGCVLDGITDDSTAFNKCITIAASINTALLIDAPCYLNSNITIPQNVQLVFVGNGKLKPGSSKQIILGQTPQAGLWQIFDYTSGGTVLMPIYRDCEVWAEWWGANGDGVSNLANDVAINDAFAAISNSTLGSAGYVRLGAGAFYISNAINQPPYCSLKGMGNWTLIKANAAINWSGLNGMFYAYNASGSHAIFDSRVEDVRIDANYANVASVGYILNVSGWQQRCGLRRVQLYNYGQYGFYYPHDYGAAELSFDEVDLFPADVVNAIGIYVHCDATQGWMNCTLSRINMAASGDGKAMSGIQLDGRVNGIINAIDVETIYNGITLSDVSTLGGASLSGSGLKAGGSAGITAIVRCAMSWDAPGQVNVTGVEVGGATAVLSDANRSYAYAAIQPYDGQLVWPPSMARPIGTAYITGGDTPVVAAAQGVCSTTIANEATGQQRITLNTSLDGTTKMLATLSSYDTGAPQAIASMTDATHIDLYTFSKTGTAIHSGELFLQVFHVP